MTTYNEHKAASEEHMESAGDMSTLDAQAVVLAAAQVHATLALAEATMLLVRNGGR